MDKERQNFPFCKLKDTPYNMLEVLMHIMFNNALEFMFRINKESRGYLKQHIATIRNDFVNEGLITH